MISRRTVSVPGVPYTLGTAIRSTTARRSSLATVSRAARMSSGIGIDLGVAATILMGPSSWQFARELQQFGVGCRRKADRAARLTSLDQIPDIAALDRHP